MFKRRDKIKAELLPKEDLLKLIDAGTERIIFAPWNGKPIPIKVVMLSSVAINSCGDFNTVKPNDKEGELAGLDDMLRIKNIHENILRLAMVEPTFEELHAHVLGKDFVAKRRAELDRIEQLIPKLDNDEDIIKYNKMAQQLEIVLAFLLPEDFMCFIVEYILQTDKTDVDKLTTKMLLEAGWLGERYRQRPSDFIEGTFTEKQRIDIDVAALTAVHEHAENEKMKKGNIRWIGRK